MRQLAWSFAGALPHSQAEHYGHRSGAAVMLGTSSSVRASLRFVGCDSGAVELDAYSFQLSKEGAMSSALPLQDAAGRRRSPATAPGFGAGRSPHNKGHRYPADPPTVDEIVAVMRQAAHTRHGHRLNALIVVLWRAGPRIQEALCLTESDLDQRRGSILIRHGKNARRREVGMDAWAWSALEPWLAARVRLPVGPLFCVIDGPTRGRAWSAGAARIELHRVAFGAGVRRRFAPHQLRHAHAVELLPEGIPLPLIQRQLGHSHLSTTGTYLQGIDTEEITRRSMPAARR